MKKYLKYFSISPVKKRFYILARKAIGDMGDLRKQYAHARYASIWNLKWVYHPECPKRLIICIIRTVTEACESPQLRVDLRRQNGMVKTAFLFICILLILSTVNINNEDLLITRLIFNVYAQISCKNDWNWNSFLLLNTNAFRIRVPKFL